MKKYLIKYTLRDGSKESVELKTGDLFFSLSQFERNRDILSWDQIKLI